MKKFFLLIGICICTVMVHSNSKNQKRIHKKIMRTILWSQNCYKILGLNEFADDTESAVFAAYHRRMRQIKNSQFRQKQTAFKKLNDAKNWALIRLSDDDISD